MLIMMSLLSVVSKRPCLAVRACFLQHSADLELYGCNHCHSAVLRVAYLPQPLRKAVPTKVREVSPMGYTICLVATAAEPIVLQLLEAACQKQQYEIPQTE